MALPVLLLAAPAPVASGDGGESTPEAGNNMPVDNPTEYYRTLRTFGGEFGAVLGPADAFVMVEDDERAQGRHPEGVSIVNGTGRPLESELAVGRPVTAFGGVDELQPTEGGRGDRAGAGRGGA